MKTLEQKMKEISRERRRKVEARAVELIAREMSLQELRQALNKTQKTVARTLRMGQDGISRLEKRSDILLSTLRNYVEAVGGSLSLVAHFPDRDPVKISGFGDVNGTSRNSEKNRRSAAHAG
jgi:hypothetical protein